MESVDFGTKEAPPQQEQKPIAVSGGGSAAQCDLTFLNKNWPGAEFTVRTATIIECKIEGAPETGMVIAKKPGDISIDERASICDALYAAARKERDKKEISGLVAVAKQPIIVPR